MATTEISGGCQLSAEVIGYGISIPKSLHNLTAKIVIYLTMTRYCRYFLFLTIHIPDFRQNGAEFL